MSELGEEEQAVDASGSAAVAAADSMRVRETTL